jgi:Protein of unknown function (DUF3631)
MKEDMPLGGGDVSPNKPTASSKGPTNCGDHKRHEGKPAGSTLPYRLSELLAAPVSATVHLCENEETVDDLVKIGFVATTVSDHVDASCGNTLTQYFQDRHVVILPVADKISREQAETIARTIMGVVASVKICDLYPDRSDGYGISRWLQNDTAGVTLAKLIKNAPLWEPRVNDHKESANRSSTDNDELIAELAALPRLQYEKRRQAGAEELGIRVSALDKLVEFARANVDAKNTASLYQHWEVEASEEPVNGSNLLKAIVEAIQRYVFLSKEQAIAVAMWIIFTWCHDLVTHSPILFATSAEPNSGKTTLLGVVGFLVRRGMPNVEISGAALFRSINKWQPCLVIDEADDAFNDNSDLRSVVNSGWTRGSVVIRCNSDTHEPEPFSTFAPKAIGMKGRGVPDTTLSRCIIITMKPRRPDDPTEAIRDFNHLDNERFAQLRSQTMRWADDNAAAIAMAEPDMPAGFHNRRRANWKPLFAIAEHVGGGWKQAAWAAAIAIEGIHETFERSVGTQLLEAIKDIFKQRGADRVTSKDLVANLIDDPTGPWATFGKNQKPITENGVARLLKPYGIRPRTIRTASDTAKGYQVEWFEDAFDRHLSRAVAEAESEIVTSSQVNEFKTLGQKQAVTPNPDVTDGNARNPLNANSCDGVTDEDAVIAPGNCEGAAECVVDTVTTVPAWQDETVGEFTDGADQSCKYCQRASDGSEQRCAIAGATLWLHPDCQRPFLAKIEAEGLPW